MTGADLITAVLDACVVLTAALGLFWVAAALARGARHLWRSIMSTPTPTPAPGPSPRRRRAVGTPPASREDRLRTVVQVAEHLRGHPDLAVPLIEPDPATGGAVRLVLPMLTDGSPRLLLAWLESLRRIDAVAARPLPARELAEVLVTGRLARHRVLLLARVRLELPPLADGEHSAPLPLRVLRDWAPAGPGPAARVMAAIHAAGAR